MKVFVIYDLEDNECCRGVFDSIQDVSNSLKLPLRSCYRLVGRKIRKNRSRFCGGHDLFLDTFYI